MKEKGTGYWLDCVLRTLDSPPKSEGSTSCCAGSAGRRKHPSYLGAQQPTAWTICWGLPQGTLFGIPSAWVGDTELCLYEVLSAILNILNSEKA